MLDYTLMTFVSKFIARTVLSGIALYFASQYFPGFTLSGGTTALAFAALALALLNTFVRPILRLIATPLIWLTLGLANILIHVAILWLADFLLPQLVIADLPTLFWVAIIIAVANAFF